MVYEAFGMWFYKLNPELFKENVTDTLVEKGIIKTIGVLDSRMGLDKGPNMVEEMIRRDMAMYKYLAQITSRTKDKDNFSNANNHAAINNPVNTSSQC